MQVQVTPAMVAGIDRPGEGRHISPEAADIVARLREHYRANNKMSAAHNYSRHLRSFFSWCEGAGYSVHNLPGDAMESFLASLAAAGQKETTLYVMRTQLKSALREVHNVLGVDMSHLEYQTGKPPVVRKAQKAKEKKDRAEKRLIQTTAQLQAIQAAQMAMGVNPGRQVVTGPPVLGSPVAPEPMFDTPPPEYEDTASLPEYPMSDQSAPQVGGQAAAGAVPAVQQPQQQPVVVVQMPQQGGRPTASVVTGGAQQGQAKTNVAQPGRGVTISNHTFTGPYVRISYVADGSNPLVPPGSEVALRLLPAAQLAPHGDIASYVQQFIIPLMRLPPQTAQVQFVFHEMNERRQPTGRRDELIVSVPLDATHGGAAAGQQSSQQQPVSYFGGMPMQQGPSGMDEATKFLLNKLDREAEEAKRHAAEVQDQMRKASDTTSMMMLMQQFQRAEDVKREAEARRDAETMRAMQQAQIAATPPPPPIPLAPPIPFPMPTVLPPEPQQNAAAEFAKALAESQKNMMELMLASMNRPQPAPPPPPVQKDVSEWLVPFMAQMNQQAMQAQQANQQLLVGVMQGMMNREDPTLKFLMQQMSEVKALAASPKADEMESFADKLQKMRMVSDMLGGGGNQSILTELLANADTIGAGAAKVIAAAKAGKEPAVPQMMLRPSVSGAPQLPASTTTPTSTPTQPTEAVIPAPPEEALKHLEAMTEGVTQDDDQAVVGNVIELIKSLLNASEPYPVIGRRMLVTLKTAEDSADLMILVKNLWTQLGQQVDRPAAKAVTKVLSRWYSVIHQQVFGEPRNLPDADDVEPATTDEQTEAVDEATDEEAEFTDAPQAVGA